MTATLEQRQCEYVPHVMILPIGAQLEIVNSDAVLHNVHAYFMRDQPDSLFNIAQPKRSLRRVVRLIPTAGLLMITCDIHPWMNAYIRVAEHPYFAVTDEEGHYVLDNVPPGSYKIRMWHEGVAVIDRELERDRVRKYQFEEPYEVMKDVRVPPKATVSVDFELALH